MIRLSIGRIVVELTCVPIDVNGAAAHPLYELLKSAKPGLLGTEGSAEAQRVAQELAGPGEERRGVGRGGGGQGAGDRAQGSAEGCDMAAHGVGLVFVRRPTG